MQAGLAEKGADDWIPRKVSAARQAAGCLMPNVQTPPNRKVQNVPLGYTVEDILQLHKTAGIDTKELWPGSNKPWRLIVVWFHF